MINLYLISIYLFTLFSVLWLDDRKVIWVVKIPMPGSVPDQEDKENQ